MKNFDEGHQFKFCIGPVSKSPHPRPVPLFKTATRCEQFQYENSSSVILKVAFLRKMLMI